MGTTLRSQSLYALHIKLNPALSMLKQLCCEFLTSSNDASEKGLSVAKEGEKGKNKLKADKEWVFSNHNR